MQKVSESRQSGPAARAKAMARSADQLRVLLAVLESLPVEGIVDRAHADRLGAIEEAARLVAEAAIAAPGSLRAEPVRGFSTLVMRLAVEVADPRRSATAFPAGTDLAALEAGHGSLSAVLMGLAVALLNMQSDLGGSSATSLPPTRIEEVVRVPLPEARAWARAVEPAVSRLERDVLMRPVDPALSRDAWSLACLVSIALAHVADHACVDARAALGRVAEAGQALVRAVALRASQAAGDGSAADCDAERSCLALVAVVDQGVGLLRDAISRRREDATLMAWRLLSRGRTGLGPDVIVRLAVGAGGQGVSALGVAGEGAALARAASLHEAEWAERAA